MKKKYVSEMVKCEDIKSGVINGVVAPCGSGKTTFFINEILNKAYNKSRILYLVDTTVLEESLLTQHSDIFQPYDPNVKDSMGFAFMSENHRLFDKTQKALVMTYARFGAVAKKNKDCNFLDKIDLICCDEVHNLAKYINYDKAVLKKNFTFATDNEIEQSLKLVSTHMYGLMRLVGGAKNNKFKVLFMTATPKRIEGTLKDLFSHEMDYLVKEGQLKGYLYNEHRVYAHIDNIIDSVQPSDLSENEKVLMYIETIKQSQDVRKRLESKGFRVADLWSVNNKKEMDDFSQEVRRHILQFEEIPHTVDIVIINGAYETGYNIFDKDNFVRTVMVHSRVGEVITQVRGRIRHDLDCLITLGKETDFTNTTVIEGSIIGKFCDRPLEKADKDKLCEELAIKDSKGQIMKWTRVKKVLIEQGFKVESKQLRLSGKVVRYDVIEK